MSAAAQAMINVYGVRSPVYLAGAQDRTEAVVFLHGNPGPARDWADLLSRTGDFARAIAPDMPGFGDADKPRDFDYTIDGYARHLAGLLRELEIQRVHLVMHDFGGGWGLTWAAQNPEAVASATLINTGVLPGYKWHRYAKIWRTPVLGELFQLTATRRAFRALILRENPRLPESAIDSLFQAGRGIGTTRAIVKLYRASPASRMRGPIEQLRAMNVPASVLWGTDDVYLPWSYAERQLEAFPSATVTLLEGLGHWPMLEDPARVAENVVPFLRSQLHAPVA